jgi:hypothetical protein
MERPIEAVKEGAWREVAAINAALRAGELDEAGWHRSMADLVRPAYLSADTPWGQSGKGGDQRAWTAARRFVIDALDRDATFLDCGCASGYLMECVRTWAAEKGLDVEPYGLDIVPELVELARRRLPHWADRIWLGNALHWRPPRRFDVIRVGLEYVPEHRRPDLVRHLLGFGDRLIIGPYTEEIDRRDTEESLKSWGFPVTGRSDVPHHDPRVHRRIVWLDTSR